jgi:CDP-2,3-bis-(O-geranylgeranyl)-sn-glycerol synthase
MPLQVLGNALWFILPAYVANATPVVLGGGPPLDMGRRFIDGRRILGEGKTIRGFGCGLIAGSTIGALQGVPWLGFLLALGALLGDLAGSFIKRRLGISRGEAVPGLDQLYFVVGALLLASPIKVVEWAVLAAIFIVTPPIHLGTNFVGYKLGLKSRPW